MVDQVIGGFSLSSVYVVAADDNKGVRVAFQDNIACPPGFTTFKNIERKVSDGKEFDVPL
jgi:hypothetical protein